MEHVGSLGGGGHIEHTSFSQDVYANLPNAGPHFVHGLPIRGVQPSLNEAQLETGSTPGFCRKLPEVLKAGADKLQGLHIPNYISLLIGYQYT